MNRRNEACVCYTQVKSMEQRSVSYAQKEMEAPRWTSDINQAQAATSRLMAIPFLHWLYLLSPILSCVCSAPQIQVKGEIYWLRVLPESFRTGVYWIQAPFLC